MSNNKKTLRYAFWLGMLPIGVVVVMVLTIGGTMLYSSSKSVEVVEKPITDTVVVEKEVIRYIDTPRPTPRPVEAKATVVKPVATPQTTDTTSN